ncbi:MAG TPA: hypothetical protein VFC00_23155 [Micromonosporaceae bacterium]|nr:hypothetical protein [Micromonosporaceae bacterium]
MSTKEVIARLDAAVCALGDVDVSGWSDDALRNHLTELSAVLCQVDAQLARLADAVRNRGFAVQEA